MNTEQARQVFDTARDAHLANGDVTQAANCELLREYFTNPSFRTAMGADIFQISELARAA